MKVIFTRVSFGVCETSVKWFGSFYDLPDVDTRDYYAPTAFYTKNSRHDFFTEYLRKK